MQVFAENLEETYMRAQEFVTRIRGLKKETATIVALYGELGSGKTSFVQGVAKALGIRETIISPTFILLKKYEFQKIENGCSELVHIDLYRLEDGSELEKFNWDEMVRNPQKIIFIEWAEKAEQLLPNDVTRIHFEVTNTHGRKISFTH